MSEQTFHTTAQDIRKAESHASHARSGNTPKDSNISAMKSIIDQNTDKAKEIEERKANLPLPDQPPVASDWQSADQRTVNVGSGRFEAPVSGEGNSALRGPATAGSSVRISGDELHKETQPTGKVGRQAVEGLSDLPKDALAR
ncbi:uncharacterized protein ACLA_021880 [Aspergillus clavatus NRRL 1]|uniref:Uncharacterized protein n=1 Tax=Aspergillus clavatus (strain ATCC 1007 / CBS 513.65 / DSM 816 / NCTC 3887 / NRRL 1 / QM 1276 / 107) TaxID=344612 RepID=A1CPA3_ASPCL|nr:uncharacterized protein ACLA_021880 [Aspergillus clavatus NRRL 1]EAW07474.1 conserved hypothetical protein [Aspergillus clavatus NRRL 1]